MFEYETVQSRLKAALSAFDELQGYPPHIITGAWHDRPANTVHILMTTPRMNPAVCTWIHYDTLVDADELAIGLIVADWMERWERLHDDPYSSDFIRQFVPGMKAPKKGALDVASDQ